MKKPHILFVDDESAVLSALRRSLRNKRSVWDTSFANSGDEALQMLNSKSIQVVVTDMRMPQMDGAELLTRVREQFPGVVRIVLSGHSEKEAVLRLIGTAHQYLTKPCETQELVSVLEAAIALQQRMTHEKMRDLLTQINALPSEPVVYRRVVEALQRTSVSTRQIGKIISEDTAMTAKILQLVNSSFFTLKQRIEDPQQAAALLGLDTLKQLILVVSVFSEANEVNILGYSVHRLREHSLATGALARKIAESQGADKDEANLALVAGLLHDNGKLIFAHHLTEDYRQVMNKVCEQNISVFQAEHEIFTCSHADLGAYLMGLWGLPFQIIEAIAFHHTPNQINQPQFNALSAIHIANAFTQSKPRTIKEMLNDGLLDQDYLTALGLLEQLPAFEAMHQEIVAAPNYRQAG